ncbi:MAG: aminomethyl-transferring glycine dehydrogenase subunit GcvPA [Myxococcota bacterium]
MRYLPHTEAELTSMLRAIGVEDVDSLFDAIPQNARLEGPLKLEASLDEASLMEHLSSLAEKNNAASMMSFLGGGMYDHHIPPAVDQLLLRSEFYTAYTPYQPEVAQGTLQAIYEFQTIVCELFGNEVANASMYDGASATAEAVMMARRVTRRGHCILSSGLHPDYIATTQTYVAGIANADELSTVPIADSGQTDLEALRAQIHDGTAAVVVGYPNFLGCVEDLEAIATIAKSHGALLITATQNPYAMSVLTPPGNYADITVGEGQALATTPQLGGPGVGLFACRNAHLRQMPGRLVGETLDQDGERGYVLTLSTREQHIRRERATSNICTNHGLIALSLAIRTSMLGKQGFQEVGRICLSRAHYLRQKLLETGLFEQPYSAPTFNEFVLRSTRGSAADFIDAAARRGVLAGIDLGRYRPEWNADVLMAVSEKRSRAQLDRFVDVVVNM